VRAALPAAHPLQAEELASQQKALSEMQQQAQKYNAELQQYNSKMQGELQVRRTFAFDGWCGLRDTVPAVALPC